MGNISGKVFDVQRFSVHDGPGIRTTFFMKGCPLRCKWCHNPEGLIAKEQLQFITEKCIGCRECISVCDNNCHKIINNTHTVQFENCTDCFKCIEVCPSTALSKFGYDLTPDDVLEKALSDKVFYGDVGGVTFSGGEALSQTEFVLECLKICKDNNINTAIDTSGFTSWDNIELVIPFTDVFLYDIKAVSDEVHISGTGVSNDIILSNFKRLIDAGSRVWVRTPVIPGFNANDNEMMKIAKMISDAKVVERVELMPYHILGRNKYKHIGLDYICDGLETLPKEKMSKFLKIFIDEGINVVND